MLNKPDTPGARFQIMTAILVFCLPLGVQALTNITVFLLILHSLVFNRRQHWRSAFTDPLFWFFSAFYIYLLMSLLWSQNTGDGLRQLETKMSFLLGPLFILAGRPNWTQESRKLILQAFVWGCLAAVIWAFADATVKAIEEGAFYLTHEYGRRYFFIYKHLALPLMHPGYLATYISLGLFAALELQSSQKRARNFYRFSILIFLIFMVLLQARINLIALFVVAVLAAIHWAIQRKYYRYLLLPVSMFLVVIVFLALAPQEMKKRYFQLPDFSYDISGDQFNSATYRLAEWTCAIDVIEDNLWFGTGVGDNRQALYDSYEKNKFWEGLEKRYNAHNQYLETAIVGGLTGLILLLALLVYILKRSFNQRDFLSFYGLIFLIISITTESMFERMWGVLTLTLVLPLILLRPLKSARE